MTLKIGQIYDFLLKFYGMMILPKICFLKNMFILAKIFLMMIYRIRLHYGSFLFFLWVFFLFSCKRKDMPMAKKTPVDIDTIAQHFYDKNISIFPIEATLNRDYIHNDQLSMDIDADFIKTTQTFLESTIKDIENVDTLKLNQNQKITYVKLNNYLKNQMLKYSMNMEYFPFMDKSGLAVIFPILGSGMGLQPFETETDYENWLKRMNQFALWMELARQNFDKGIENQMVLPKSSVLNLISYFQQKNLISPNMSENIFYQPIKNIPNHIKKQKRLELEKSYTQMIQEKIIPAYENMNRYLSEKYIKNARELEGIYTLPQGDEIYKNLISIALNKSYSPMEIHRIGIKEVARIKAEMEKFKNEIQPEMSLLDFLNSIREQKNPHFNHLNKKEVNYLTNFQKKINSNLSFLFGKEAKKYSIHIKKNKENLLYLLNSQNYFIPSVHNQFYVHQDFVDNDDIESNFCHHIFAGKEYWNFLNKNKQKSIHWINQTSSYYKGWGHYMEVLAYEKNWYSDEKQKWGALNNQMLYSIDLVIDTGIHTGIMTRERALDYILKHTTLTPEKASSRVDRIVSEPAQSLAVKMGQLQIVDLKLKKEKQEGKKFRLEDFHNEILNH